MCKLKKELEELIERFGVADSRVLAKSQELDLEIVEEMRKK
jgi:hypothetical protein